MLSLERPGDALAVLEDINYKRLTPFGISRIEVHRALAIAKSPIHTNRERLKQALGSLNLAAVALLDDGPSMFPRPSWIWWSDDHGFIRSWEAETLRSLTPAVAEPAFRAAISFASKQDNRERPFLVAGLAGVLEQCDAVEEASDQAIQALVLARAVRADAAFSRIRRIYSRLSLRAPQNSYVRSLGDALYDI